MCGIFGGIGISIDDAAACLRDMPRGNDGITVQKYGDIVLGSRRNLVKKSGAQVEAQGNINSDQPYENVDRTIALVFNGELYNFDKFRNQLLKTGTHFSSEGDTEVWLRLYEKYDEKFVEQDGIDSLYALAVADTKKKRLTISRDWPGRVPLFYYYDKKRRIFLFSSELKAFRSLKFVKLSEPIDLVPGTSIQIDTETFELTILTHYKPAPRRTEHDLSTMGRELDRLMNVSGKNRTMGDVPICTMLSGGIDSVLSTFYVFSNIDFSKVDYEPISYVFGIADREVEDIRRARISAAHFSPINLKLKEVRAPAHEIVRDMPHILELFENRQIKALSVYPLPIYYYLGPVMSADGFKATVGGHGVDELLGAYDSWKELSHSHAVQTKVVSRVAMMNAIYKNMTRRASTILMNRGPVEARALFMNRELSEYMMGIDPKWLTISTQNAEYLLRLFEAHGGTRQQWTEQMSAIYDHVVSYLDNGGTHPEGADDHAISEIEKLFWKLPLICAGAMASTRSFLPFASVLNSKLRGQHGAGISSLESDIVSAYKHYGSGDAEIYQAMVNKAFNLAA